MDEIGGPTTHNNYPWGWTMAGNTPFKRSNARCTRAGWPTRAWCPGRVGWRPRPGGWAEFTHAIDVLPTVLELGRVETPRGHRPRAPVAPFDGVELRPTCSVTDGAGRPERHVTQPSRCWGARAIYHEGIEGGHFPPTRDRIYPDGLDPNAPFDDDIWELYHVAEDLSETEDLAAQRPGTWPSWWSCGGGRPNATRSSRSTTGALWAMAHPRPGPPPPRDVGPVLPRGGAGARAGGGERAEPFPRHHRRGAASRRGRS